MSIVKFQPENHLNPDWDEVALGSQSGEQPPPEWIIIAKYGKKSRWDIK
jgi:hypothetical protein